MRNPFARSEPDFVGSIPNSQYESALHPTQSREQYAPTDPDEEQSRRHRSRSRADRPGTLGSNPTDDDLNSGRDPLFACGSKRDGLRYRSELRRVQSSDQYELGNDEPRCNSRSRDGCSNSFDNYLANENSTYRTSRQPHGMLSLLYRTRYDIHTSVTTKWKVAQSHYAGQLCHSPTATPSSG